MNDSPQIEHSGPSSVVVRETEALAEVEVKAEEHVTAGAEAEATARFLSRAAFFLFSAATIAVGLGMNISCPAA